jgi:hypothetical protein
MQELREIENSLIANRNNHEIDYWLQDEWKGAVSLLGAKMKGEDALGLMPARPQYLK